MVTEVIPVVVPLVACVCVAVVEPDAVRVDDADEVPVDVSVDVLVDVRVVVADADHVDDAVVVSVVAIESLADEVAVLATVVVAEVAVRVAVLVLVDVMEDVMVVTAHAKSPSFLAWSTALLKAATKPLQISTLSRWIFWNLQSVVKESVGNWLKLPLRRAWRTATFSIHFPITVHDE